MVAALVVVAAAIEAGLRLGGRRQSDAAASRLDGLVLVVIGVTAAGGLGLLIGGGRPNEGLHFVYGAVALGALPTAGVLSARWQPRSQAAATLAGSLLALVAILRLFATG